MDSGLQNRQPARRCYSSSHLVHLPRVAPVSPTDWVELCPHNRYGGDRLQLLSLSQRETRHYMSRRVVYQGPERKLLTALPQVPEQNQPRYAWPNPADLSEW